MSSTFFAIHHARGMGAAIYILKMFVCQGFFPQSLQQQQEVTAMAPFVIFIYFYPWFKCTSLADTPQVMLKLHQNLQKWSAIDKEGAKAALRKLDLHTDYLNGRSVAVAFASKMKKI